MILYLVEYEDADVGSTYVEVIGVYSTPALAIQGAKLNQGDNHFPRRYLSDYCIIEAELDNWTPVRRVFTWGEFMRINHLTS